MYPKKNKVEVEGRRIVTVRSDTLVEAACKFWNIFDVASNFYKLLENAKQILHALQNDCCMETFRKIFDALR